MLGDVGQDTERMRVCGCQRACACMRVRLNAGRCVSVYVSTSACVLLFVCTCMHRYVHIHICMSAPACRGSHPGVSACVCCLHVWELVSMWPCTVDADAQQGMDFTDRSASILWLQIHLLPPLPHQTPRCKLRKLNSSFPSILGCFGPP